jgi:CDP-glucose 4,6-dehydratase
VQKLISISGKSHLEPVIMKQATNEIIQQYVSSEKARALLGWARKYSLSDGLKVTYDWYARQIRAG